MNPCSFFCFGAFLAFLWICAPRKFLQFVVGVVFITVLGVLHFTQQTQSSLYSQLIPPLKMAAPWVGLLLILSIVSMYRKRLPKMHLTETPWIFIVLILTVLVEYIYQQPIRGFNLSLVFEQWLIEQTMPPVNRLVCEVGYQLVYLLPISIILLVYLLIQHRPWVSRYQDNFKTAGCFILMSIAILLVGHPQWLAHFFISSVVILVAIGLAFIVKSVRIS